MYPPAHIDGLGLVILRQNDGLFGRRFEVVESGWLSYDGETLTFESDRGDQPREVNDSERAQILDVSSANRIAECNGYDLFILQ